ncbi:MAG TPA: tetratricopeptide repeat protein [Ktedonobacteraceae bacterium]|nr:tetratricopeptide repeat protein [Ktedonobacteraceae bacterium]
MAVICIQECSEQAGVFQAKISFNQRLDYDITVRDPFSKEEEERLEWYFEEHLKFPFTHQVKAQEAAASITEYGEKLFAQIFSAHSEIHAAYQTITQEGLGTLQIEVVGPPSFHALHWEALKDPELSGPLALQAAIVRKNGIPQELYTTISPSPTINLLIVTARPRGRRDVSYRTISGPLIETLRQADIPMQIDILRPGTYKALKNHLLEIISRRGVGYYHVIHFDVHGSLLTYDAIPSWMRRQRYGRQDLRSYEGLRAFLSLEGERENQMDLMEAEELAELLLQHQIPIAILNACQSGKQVGEYETSLGSHLMQAGVQMVVAMGYSVTINAAELLMRTLYQHLFAKKRLAVSIRHGRAALYTHKARHAYFSQTIELEDWLLPVVYQNREYPLQLRSFTSEELATFNRRAATRYAAPQPRYDFAGRDLDILQIEKYLLTKRNIILVRGMGGTGKTTLLQHLGWWWQTTGFVEHVFYFGYDQCNWTLRQILANMAEQLLDKEQYCREFQPLDLDAQQDYLFQYLRAENRLLILDNLESITSTSLMIHSTLPNEELDSLHEFLVRLAGKRILVLLGSRSGEDWLAEGTFGDNVYELVGLDPEAASTLANSILEHTHATKYYREAEEDLQRLLRLLDGFPLALEGVLTNLASGTPFEVLAALQAGDINLVNTSSSEKKTENILQCIAYSYNNLSSEAQQLLLCLAPFSLMVDQNLLDHYTISLRQQSPLAELPFEHWSKMIQQAKNWGLLSPDPIDPRFLHLQPTLPYFLRTRLRTPNLGTTYSAIKVAYREVYELMSNWLYDLLHSKDRRQREMGLAATHLEYENLLTALNWVLDAQVSVSNPYKVLSSYLDLTHDEFRGLKLGQVVLDRLAEYPPDKLTDQVGPDLAGIIDDVASRQLALKRYTEAEASYRKALSIWLHSNKAGEAWEGCALFYHQLGNVFFEQRQWEQAEMNYQQALHIRTSFNDRLAQADSYGQLGMVARAQLQWEQAEQYYQKALQIFIDHNDRPGQARVYANFGNMAQQRERWDQAEQYYLQAQPLFLGYDDYYSLAQTYHNLSMVARAQQRWGQAERYCQQALQTYIHYKDHHAQAITYGRLGDLALAQEQWAQAEQYYQKALQIYIDNKDRYHQADSHHNLGIVAHKQKQWGQAGQHYQQALQLFVDLDDLGAQAGEYKLLGVLAQEQQHWEQARDDYLRALERYLVLKDSPNGQIIWRMLMKLWQMNNDASIPTAVASMIDATPKEVEMWFRQLKDTPNHPLVTKILIQRLRVESWLRQVVKKVKRKGSYV